MFRLLSDLEVALNELLVACRESVDHFRDATQLIDDENIAREFKQIAAMREAFLPALENKIRELGDLPSMPDKDKEDSEMLLHHLGAAVSADYTDKVLQQRIEAEKTIIELSQKARNNDTNNFCKHLLDELLAQANQTIEKLSAFAESPL